LADFSSLSGSTSYYTARLRGVVFYSFRSTIVLLFKWLLVNPVSFYSKAASYLFHDYIDLEYGLVISILEKEVHVNGLHFHICSQCNSSELHV